VRLDKSRIAGFVTFLGSASSHTAILARAMGIPALVGVGRISEAMDGAWGLLDAAKGELILGATAEEKEAFAHAQAAENRIAKEHEAYLLSLINKPAITRGGHKIMIYANLANGSEVDAALSQGAEGIGLLRSEFLYLEQDDFPSEELLFSAYADIASQMQGRRTIIRTLDVGADKQIPYFDLPQEENPALGFRAIRLCLARKEMFCTQLRAILRASAYGRVAIMLPMIVSVAEVRECRRLLETCKKDLEERGLLGREDAGGVLAVNVQELLRGGIV
jgi:phosphotransferase system enzyme I (PtsI)